MMMSPVGQKALQGSKSLCSRFARLIRASRCRLGPKMPRLTDKHDESISKLKPKKSKTPNGAYDIADEERSRGRSKEVHFKRTRLTLLTKLMTSTSYEINYIFFFISFVTACTCCWMVDFWFSAKKRPLWCVPSGEQKRNYRKVEKLTRKDDITEFVTMMIR